MSEMKKNISQVHLTRSKELLLQKVTQKNKKIQIETNAIVFSDEKI